MAGFYGEEQTSSWGGSRAGAINSGVLSPSVIPTVASIAPLQIRAAGGAYGANEQTQLTEHDEMLRALYDAMVKLGAVR